MKNKLSGNATLSIQTTASRIWHALTKPDLIKLYFFCTEAISDWTEGSPIIFKGEREGKSYEDKGTILIVEQDKLFRYNYWSSIAGIEDSPENYVIITYELFEEGGYTTLNITQENIPDESMKLHFDYNWRKVMNDLKVLLEKERPVFPESEF